MSSSQQRLLSRISALRRSRASGRMGTTLACPHQALVVSSRSLGTFSMSCLLEQKQNMQNQQRQSLVSSAFPDLPMPDSVRDSVKSSILEHATREDSRLWKQQSQTNGHYHNHHQQQQPSHPQSQPSINGYHNHNNNHESSGDLNQAIGTHLDDPLDDLYIQQPTRYWPHLPSQVDETTVADPVQLAQEEIDQLSTSIREDLIGNDHPILNSAASYFFQSTVDGGKKVRPMLVLLLSRALADSASSSSNSNCHTNGAVSTTGGQAVHENTTTSPPLLTHPLAWQRPDLPQTQRRLAEISEMIHTASLFHDDVIDGADTRRSIPAVHKVFGNKMAILAGDYLLARACICLARLRNVEVVETMATIIENLVRGEVMQLRGAAGTTSTEAAEAATTTTMTETTTNSSSSSSSNDRLIYYLRKNFYKTGSLMANSCKSAALLGSYSAELVDASYRFGKHVGMAFQLVDDVLDFEGSLSQLGKPALADLNAGLATAPVLFAAEEYPDELLPLISRKFQHAGDVDRAVQLVFGSSGIERTKQLARLHAEHAMDAVLEELAPSVYRDSLVQLAYKVVARTK